MPAKLTREEAEQILQKITAERPAPRALMTELKPDLPTGQSYWDFEFGVESLLGYITTNLPELYDGGKRIIEVGPGACCFMLCTRAMGNTVTGEELPLTAGHYVRAYARIAEYWQLDVHYEGFHRYIRGDLPFPYQKGSIDLFHFRGSLDGVLLPFRDGVQEAVKHMLGLLTASLRPGGCIFIAHNTGGDLQEILYGLERHHGMLQRIRAEPTVTKLVKQ
jgi:hypothetical protein